MDFSLKVQIIINHPVPERSISNVYYVCVSGPPLLEKRRGNLRRG
jgi:hypothetical protein